LGAVQDQRELHQLGRLELHRTGADPALRTVGLVSEPGEFDGEQQDESEPKQRSGECSQSGDAAPRNDDHHAEADRRPGDEADQRADATATGDEQRRRGRAVDHHRTKRQ
jgi:hypothetical protein